VRRLAVLAACLIAWPAEAQAPAPARSGPAVGSAAEATPGQVPGRRVDDTLLAATLQRQPLVSTPRLGRGFDDAAPACRKDCSDRYLRCGLANEPATCGPQWSQCLSRCSTLVTRR
jgi:hypothetical protein